MVTQETQQQFLHQAKAILGVTWNELAAHAEIAPRALKTYRMPLESQDFRAMPQRVREVVAALVTRAKASPDGSLGEVLARKRSLKAVRARSTAN